MFMTNLRNAARRLLPAAILGFLAATPCAGEPRLAIAFDAPWKVQPASSLDIPPNDADWGTTTSGSWKNGAALKRGNTSWAGSDTSKVHSLWFEKEFTVPVSRQGDEIVADFPRIEGDAVVFVGDRRVTELLRPGGQVNLTTAVQFGKSNKLRVFLTRDYTGISRPFKKDPLRYEVRTKEQIPMSAWGLGITAPVTVTAKPKLAIGDVFVVSSWRNKTLSLEVELSAAERASDLRIEATVLDEKSQPVLALRGDSFAVSAGKSARTVTAAWENPVCWELDKPYLYKVRVTLCHGGKVADEYPSVTFGFREIWTEGKELLMNGHPSRWRLTEIYGADKNGISMYRLLGYNVGQIQPHPNLWWTDSAETPLFDEALLEEMDRVGMGCTVPVPSVALLRDKLHKGSAAGDYGRETEFHLRKYRNHPSILAWVVGMNSYCPTQNITPQAMGIREENPKGQGKVINDAVEIVHRNDPTRLAFSHADGSTGDVSSANCYLNFVPLQEREEWPMAWAAKGNMPYCAVEFGAPFASNFWKGKQFLLTEYLAMYFGDQPYLTESGTGLRKTVDHGLLNKNGFGKWAKVDSRQYPAYYDLLRLFARNTNRAWRTWGVNAGWMYWLIGERYGHPSKTHDVPAYEHLNYNFLAQPLTEKPAWANEYFDIFSEANGPLLAYIGGWPVHTDKTHSYFAGETLQKQMVFVWDGGTERSLQAQWALKEGGKTMATGTQNITVPPGGIRLSPLAIPLQKEVSRRTECVLEMTVSDGGHAVATDRFALEVFPKPLPIRTAARIAVYDPLNKSLPELRAAGLQARDWSAGSSAKDADLLIVGREAIRPGESLPYQPEDIAAGLRVLVLEQKPEAWRALGFETVETMPRRVFIRDGSHAIFDGLEPGDFTDWRGSPDLLPEGKYALAYDVPRAPKWTNRHAVASVALKTPHAAGFTPLLETEFDLAYSPLLEWRYGKGAVYFCSLDFSNRLETDPVAAKLAKQLIEVVARQALPPAKRVFHTGTPEEASLLRELGLGVTPGLPGGSAADALLIAGQGGAVPGAEAVRRFAQEGGTVVWLPQLAEALQKCGFRTQPQAMQRARLEHPADLLRGVGPGLLRWQDVLDVAVFSTDGQPEQTRRFADGLLLEEKTGKGRQIFLQAGPEHLAGRYADDAEKREAIQLSVLRLRRLLAQVVTNAGAGSSAPLARRVTTAEQGAFAMGGTSWRVLGPFRAGKSNGKEALDGLLSETAEADAIAGGENPNTVYVRPEGGNIDWRKTVEANENGYVDMGSALGVAGVGNMAYIAQTIHLERDQAVTINFGVDYWMRVWINGAPVLNVNEPHGMPTPNGFAVNALLKKGKNIVTVKAASGSNGFGVWCRINAQNGNPADAAASRFPLYSPLFKKFDPYRYTYW